MSIRFHSVSLQFSVQIAALHVAILSARGGTRADRSDVVGDTYFSASSMSC